MAVVLYDTEMQRGSSLGALSVLMKGENLAAASCWTGIPTKRALASIAWMRPATAAPTAPAQTPASAPAQIGQDA